MILQTAPWFTQYLLPSLDDPGTRYLVIYGGRGSGKSEAIAQLMVLLSLREPNTKILCARHIQHSIAESSKSRIEKWIQELNLSSLYHITKVDITNKTNGSKFIFKGLSNVTKENITSINDIKYLWIEEAHNITKEVWLRTDPSIRAPGSKIFITFNPHLATDILYQTFITSRYPHSLVLKINYPDNPWFPESPLHQQRLDFLQTYPDPIYRHVWEGELMEYNETPLIYPERFHTYDTLPPEYQMIISVDTAYTTKESSDYTVLGALARHRNNYYLVHLDRGKYEIDTLYQRLLEFTQYITTTYKQPSKVIIENKSAGISLIQLLQKQTKLPIFPYTPTKDKFTRVCEVLDILHSSFHLPSHAPWLSSYLDELRFFNSIGTHLHDDQVDMTTQALAYLRTHGSNSIISLYSQLPSINYSMI